MHEYLARSRGKRVETGRERGGGGHTLRCQKPLCHILKYLSHKIHTDCCLWPQEAQKGAGGEGGYDNEGKQNATKYFVFLLQIEKTVRAMEEEEEEHQQNKNKHKMLIK